MQARAVRAISYFPASAAANRCRTRRWAWLHRDALIAALDREIATEADDAASLAHEDRQKREAEVMGDLLDIERQEAAFVWKAMAHSLPVFHRNDGSPLAILQCALVTAPRAIDAPRSSLGMSWLRG